MANKLKITELDFESNKQQFIDYLKSQTQFKDYDFEGSNMSVLLDVLAYNTYQNNFYTNMALNEMFLDSAVLRNSIMSHAKELNYLPRSTKSAKAVVNVTITDQTVVGQTVTIPQYALFTTTYQGTNYEFVTDKAYVAQKVAPYTFVAENVEIFEGQMLASFEREGYFVDEDGLLKVILSNETADIDSIEVFVDAEATEDENVFVRKNDIFGVGPDDKVFYVEPYYDGRYQIYFGNNIFGVQPTEIQDVRVKYRICSGSAPNGASQFAISVSETSTATVETVEAAQGGAERETTESIRYFAPKSIQIQERAITASDYEILLKQKFPEIKSVAAYGGEKLTPPQYGKVAISVYLGQGQESLSTTQSNSYIAYLEDKTPLAVEPIFVQTEYMYADLHIDVSYNPKITSKSVGQLEEIIRTNINDFVLENLDDFNRTLRLSKLSSLIDSSDVSIVSNSINAVPFIDFSPDIGDEFNPTFKFDTELIRPYPFKTSNGFANYKPAFKTGCYTFNGVCVYLQDDGMGKVQMITDDVENPAIIKLDVGSVNYDTGEIKLINFKADAYTGNAIKVYATTKADDISSPTGRLFTVRDTEVVINLKESR